MDAKKLTLTTPVIIPETQVSWVTVVNLECYRAPDGSAATIFVRAVDNLGASYTQTYTYPPKPLLDDNVTPNPAYAQKRDALLLLTQLNTANMSVKSLHHRLLEKMVADGDLKNGTIG
jgi:hypothetical protein